MDSLVKHEPSSEMAASASVPIPGGHRGTRGIFDQFSPSPLANPAVWGNRPDMDSPSPFKSEPMNQLDISFKMDDDDIFQVDKADLIQGPTLAELNANDDTLLGDLNFDDLLLPEESIQPLKTDLMPATLLFGGGATGFAPSSFPQAAQAFNACPKYTKISSFNFNGMMGLVYSDPAEAASPPAFNSPETGNVAGMYGFHLSVNRNRGFGFLCR